MNSYISILLEPFAYLIYLFTVAFQCMRTPLFKFKLLTLYYLLTFALMSYASYYILFKANTAEDNNNWLYNTLYFFSAFFLSFYMLQTLQHQRNRKIVTVLMLVNVVNFFISNLIYQQQLFDSFASSIFVVSMVLFSFLYFQELLRNVSEQNILFVFDFWLISGYLLYYLGSFFIILSWRRLSETIVGEPTDEQGRLFALLWSVHNILLFISCLITLTGVLWINYRSKSRLLS